MILRYFWILSDITKSIKILLNIDRYCRILSDIVIWLEIVNFGQVMLLERGLVEVLGKIMEMVIKLADF